MSISVQVPLLPTRVARVGDGTAGQAAPLADRFDPAWRPIPGGDDGARLRERWAAITLEGQQDRLADHARRIGGTCTGNDPTVLDRHLGPGRYLRPPGWVSWAERILGEAASLAQALEDPTLGLPGDPAEPFSACLAPFVAVARAELAAAGVVAGDPVLEAGLLDLLRHRLGRLWWETLESALDAFRRSRSWTVATGDVMTSATYRDFVRDHLARDLLVDDLPVLMRLSVTVLRQWVEHATELATRLEADRSMLSDVFGGVGGLGALVSLSGGLSDPHRGGRTVHVLTFDSGIRVVYKPRDLGAEAATHALFAWLVDRHTDYQLRPVTVLPRTGYGWEEFVEAAPVRGGRSRSAVFFRRAGCLLAVLHALGTTDVHRENLVAAGDYPVLVDAETVLAPELVRPPAGVDPDGATSVASRRLHRSVLAVQMLPGWRLDAGGVARDVAGLGGADPHAGVREVARWRQVNTIAMSRELVPEHAPIGDNVARDAGGPIDPGPHLQDVVEGFRSTYRRILHDRDLLLSTEGPLAAFLGTRVRLLLRDTASYGLIGVSAARGEALRSGAARGVALDRLSRQLYATRSAPRLWSLYRAEIAAMEELDIPHFVVRTDSTRVELPDGSLSEPCLDATPWDALRARVLSLSEADLAWQERLVEGAFAARYVDRVEDRRATGMPVPPAPDGAGGVEGQVLTADEAVGRAVLVGEQLLSTAFTGRNGSLTWIGSTLLDVEGSQVAIIGHDLYSGAAGIGFFLASLARVTGDPRWADAARAAVGDLRYAVRHYPRQLASAVGAGAGTGAGSILYGLSAIAALLDEGDLAHDVTRLVAACDDTTMTAPTPGDVMAGTAGLLLGLLAVHGRTGDVDALALAVRCGDHLLRTAATPGRGRLTWDGFGGAPLVSVAHGTAGAGLALARLAGSAGHARFAEAAVAAARFVGAHYSPEHGTWPDLRPTVEDRFVGSGWCYGATGIGMALLGQRDILPSDTWELDVRRAVVASSDPDPGRRDSLCCGSLGRAVFLLEAGDALGAPDVSMAGQRLLAVLVRRADRTDGYRLEDGGPLRFEAPGLFRGAAGVGTALLSLHHRALLPSVLRWG